MGQLGDLQIGHPQQLTVQLVDGICGPVFRIHVLLMVSKSLIFYFSSYSHSPVMQLTIQYFEWSEREISFFGIIPHSWKGPAVHSHTFTFPSWEKSQGKNISHDPELCHFWRRVIHVKSDYSFHPLQCVQLLLFCSNCELGLLCWRPRLPQGYSCS